MFILLDWVSLFFVFTVLIISSIILLCDTYALLINNYSHRFHHVFLRFALYVAHIISFYPNI